MVETVEKKVANLDLSLVDLMVGWIEKKKAVMLDEVMEPMWVTLMVLVVHHSEYMPKGSIL